MQVHSVDLTFSASENTFKCLTSLNSFKSAYTNQLPNINCCFSVHIIRGSNFKIGLSVKQAPLEEDFSDHCDAMAYYSMGQLRGKSHKFYGVKYGAGDTVKVYVNRERKAVFFEVNGTAFGDAFILQNSDEELYGAVSCLYKEEEFILLFPEAED
jgi:SPRY domain